MNLIIWELGARNRLKKFEPVLYTKLLNVFGRLGLCCLQHFYGFWCFYPVSFCGCLLYFTILSYMKVSTTIKLPECLMVFTFADLLAWSEACFRGHWVACFPLFMEHDVLHISDLVPDWMLNWPDVDLLPTYSVKLPQPFIGMILKSWMGL